MPAVYTSASTREERTGPVAGRHLAVLAVDAAHEKKALDVTVMDLRGISGEVDYFVICTGETDAQIRAIVESVVEKLKVEAGEPPSHREGIPGSSRWILLDYFDLVVHVFSPELRSYYDLERLWGDAPTERVADDAMEIGVLSEEG